MADFWIVSSYKFRQHRSLESAEAEMKRLTEKHAEGEFRVYRIKHSLNPSDSKGIIARLESENYRLQKMLEGMQT